jgi:hypothetical protein
MSQKVWLALVASIDIGTDAKYRLGIRYLDHLLRVSKDIRHISAVERQLHGWKRLVSPHPLESEIMNRKRAYHDGSQSPIASKQPRLDADGGNSQYASAYYDQQAAASNALQQQVFHLVIRLDCSFYAVVLVCWVLSGPGAAIGGWLGLLCIVLIVYLPCVTMQFFQIKGEWTWKEMIKQGNDRHYRVYSKAD